MMDRCMEAMGSTMDGGMMGMDGGGMFGGLLLVGLFLLLLWMLAVAVLGALGVWALRRLSGRGSTERPMGRV